ncbi:MAG: CHAT domain-containing protein [Blastocatellia bacterium]|nr:CHAT domain-containing protein [Blastocatellia bacterium]
MATLRTTRLGSRLFIAVLSSLLSFFSVADFSQPIHPSPFVQSISEVTIGKPVERELAGGQTHSYRLDLAANQFLALEVEQRGIDVTLRLLDPNRKSIKEVNSQKRKRLTEKLRCFTEAAGVWTVEVLSAKPDAEPGKYEIRLLELRAPTDRDRKLEQAQALFEESAKIRGTQSLKAMELAKNALELRERLVGPDHPEVAATLNLLAVLAQNQGDFAGAEMYYQRSLAIREKVLGSKDYETGQSLNNLGIFYWEKTDYARAEPLFQQALAIYEAALGADDVLVASVLNNLGLMYTNKGDFEKAEPILQRAVALWEKATGPAQGNTAFALNNLSELYQARKEFAQAEAALQWAVSIWEKTLGLNHPALAQGYVNLAKLYKTRKDYAKAREFDRKALAIWEKNTPPSHHMSLAFSNLGDIALLSGEFPQAESFYRQALALQEKILGAEHPEVAESLDRLANLARARGNTLEAISFQARCNEVREKDFAQNLTTGSERQKLLYLNLAAAEFDHTVSLHVQDAPREATALQTALTAILRRKGRSLDVMTNAIAVLRRRASTEDNQLLTELFQARQELSRRTLAGPEKETPEQYRTGLKTIEEKVERLENQISATGNQAKTALTYHPVTIESVRKAIPSEAALVEFVEYRPCNPKTMQFGPSRTVVYTLANEGEPVFADLGETAPIEQVINRWRVALRNKNSSLSREVKPLARKVDTLVMQPVRKLLGKKTHLLLSPDGILNLIPFGALVDEKGRFLVERYEITYLSSGRDLLQPKRPTEPLQSAMIVAAPDFGPQSQPALSATAASRFFNLNQAYFPPLPGTEQEAAELWKLLPQAKMLTGREATKTALQTLAAPQLLHIATHGFFIETTASRPEEQGSTRSLERVDDTPLEVAENPLLRSGLGLAGANLHRSNGDDGILTALEMAGLDLWGTKLVVLSACDTGIGEVKTGEGVYGLRRALVLAGSESQVISLWPVSDLGTRSLMADYYKGLLAQQGRTAALRQVQLRMLKNPASRHPFYWAAFIQSGAWGSIF